MRVPTLGPIHPCFVRICMYLLVCLSFLRIQKHAYRNTQTGWQTEADTWHCLWGVKRRKDPSFVDLQHVV